MPHDETDPRIEDESIEKCDPGVGAEFLSDEDLEDIAGGTTWTPGADANWDTDETW